jgi:hypothetical protein
MTNKKQCHPERSDSRSKSRSRRACPELAEGNCISSAPQASLNKSLSLACLTALWGLTATPQSLAACANAQTSTALHWDPILHQQWLTTTDCNHPERPAQARLTTTSTPLPLSITQPNKPLVVRAGDRISLWSVESNTRMELSAIAEESGALGASIRVRLQSAASNESSPELRGIVRGPANVELRP